MNKQSRHNPDSHMQSSAPALPGPEVRIQQTGGWTEGSLFCLTHIIYSLMGYSGERHTAC